MRPVTTAELCEKAHDKLVGSIENPYIEDEDIYTDEAQRRFEYHLHELEDDLADKGYRRNLKTSEWEPTRFYIGDPSLLLKEDNFQEMLRDISSREKDGWGRYYIDLPQTEVPIMWAYTIAGDGVFLVYKDGEDKNIGEVTVDSSLIAFVPEHLVDPETAEKALKEEHVLPPRVIDIERFSFSEESGSVTLGDIRVDVE